MLLFASPVWATDYYVYCGGTGTNSGTYANPWLTISAITGVNTGDSIYFKDGSTCREKLTIPMSGTSAVARSKIGCYDGLGDFNCTGKTLPIISGADTVTGSWSDLGSDEYQISFSSDVYELYDNNGNRKVLAMEPDDGYFSADANPATRDLVMETKDDMTFSDTQIENGLLSCRTDKFSWNARKITDYNDGTDTITLDNTMPAGSTCGNGEAYILADRDAYLDEDNEWFNDTGMNVINIIETSGDPSGTTWEAVVRDYGITGTNKNFITIQDLHITKSYYAGIYLYYSDAAGNDYEISNVTVDYIGTYKYISTDDDRRHSIGIDVFMGSAGTAPTNTIDGLIDGVTVDDCVRGGVFLRGQKCESGDWCDLKNSTITDIGIPTMEYFSPHSTSSKAVYLGGNWETRYWKLDNLTIDNTGVAIYWSMNTHITNSTITDCLQDTHMGDLGCLYNHRDGDALIEYTTIDGMAGATGTPIEPRAGIYLDGALEDVTIDHVTISNVFEAVFANMGGNNTITNSTFCEYGRRGIYIFEKTNDATAKAVNGGQITGWVIQGNNFETSQAFTRHLQFWSDQGSGNPVTDWFAADAMDNNTYFPDSGGSYFAWDENSGTSPTSYDLAGWQAIRSNFETNSTVAIARGCHTFTPPTIDDPEADETGVPADGSDDAAITHAAANGTHYATDWRIILPESDCTSGAAVGSTANEELCDTGKTPWSFGSTGGYSDLDCLGGCKMCVRTYVDHDGGSDCDSIEATSWASVNFSIGAAAPTSYGTTMSTSITNCPDASNPCGATLSDTPADCGGAPCGATMSE